MRLYSFLDRLLPRSYVAKVVCVACVFGQGPLLAVALLKTFGLVPSAYAGAVIIAALAVGFVGLSIALAAIVRPVTHLEAAFTSFEKGSAQAVALPSNHRDSVGRLMAQANRMMRTAEIRIDAAQKLADRDPLTGLLNRRGMERSLAGRAETGERGAVLMMDFDHFKRVNDLHGHDTGDRVLRDLARLLRRHMRRPDLAARFGGEEFVLYLPGLGQDAALRVAERLRMAVEDGIEVGNVAQTVSIGVAPWPPGENFDAILKRADMAVYAAKGAGRNRVHLVAPARAVTRPVEPAHGTSPRSETDDTGADVGPRVRSLRAPDAKRPFGAA